MVQKSFSVVHFGPEKLRTKAIRQFMKKIICINIHIFRNLVEVGVRELPIELFLPAPPLVPVCNVYSLFPVKSRNWRDR